MNNKKNNSIKETNVSKTVKALRKGHNLTIKEMASFLGISQSAYHNYESGVRIPDIDVIFKLCVFYKLNIEIFIFLLCQDYVFANEIRLEDMFNIYTYDKISEISHIGLLERYKNLPDEYQLAVSTFIRAAEICSDDTTINDMD